MDNCVLLMIYLFIACVAFAAPVTYPYRTEYGTAVVV